jgi:hypothetical protein
MMHKGLFLFARKATNWGGAVMRAAKERSDNETIFPEDVTEKFILSRTGKWNGQMDPSHYQAQLEEGFASQ